MTENMLIKNFVKDLEDKNRSPSTIIAYKKDLEQLSDYLDSSLSTKPEKASSNDLENFVKHLIKDEEYSLKTVSRKINSLKTFYKFLKSTQQIKEDVSASIEHPDIVAKRPRVLKAMEYMALRDNVRDNIRLHTMIELLLQTGMRISEISNLKLDDINSNIDSLTVRSYKSNPKRKIELNRPAKESLKKWLKDRPVVENDQGYVFSTKTGKKVLVRNIRTSINRAFKNIRIKDATVNDIRNTFIIRQLKQGVKLEEVAKYIGHQRVTSTEKFLELLDDAYKPKISKIQPL